MIGDKPLNYSRPASDGGFSCVIVSYYCSIICPMPTKGKKSCEDIETGPQHSPNAHGSDDNLCCSDTKEQPWHSPYNSHCVSSSYIEFRLSGASSHEIDGVTDDCRRSCVSDCSVDVDLESGVPEIKVHLAKSVERDCRICHLGLVSTAPESGIAIELDCSCKGALAAAHKQCAQTWFKITGNKTCEICGSTAWNVVGVGETEVVQQWNEATSATAPPAQQTET